MHAVCTLRQCLGFVSSAFDRRWAGLCTIHPHIHVAFAPVLADFVSDSGGVVAKQKAKTRPESTGGAKLCIVDHVALKHKLSHALPD